MAKKKPEKKKDCIDEICEGAEKGAAQEGCNACLSGKEPVPKAAARGARNGATAAAKREVKKTLC